MNRILRHGPFLLLLGLGVIIRLVFISYHGLSNDELSAWFRSGFLSWDEFWYFGVTHGDMHPVFYQALLWIWIRLFGDADWVIRMPSLFFFIGNMLLIYRISRNHFSEKAAYFPLLIYIGSSFLIVNTSFARPYNSGSFFILLAFLAVLEIAVRKDRSWKWIILLTLGFLGAMASHYFAFLTAGILGVLSLISVNTKARWNVALSGVLASLCFLPHFTVTWYQLNRGGLQWLAPPDWDWLVEVAVQVFNNSVWLTSCFVLVLVFAIVKKNNRKDDQRKLLSVRLAWALFIFVLVFGYLISHLFTPVLRELVILFVLPFPLIAIGHSIQISKVWSLVIACLMLIHSFVADSIFGYHHFGDFKHVSNEINSIHQRIGFTSITHAANTNNPSYINYYLNKDISEAIKNWDEPQAVNDLYMRAQTATTPYFLYVLNNAYHSEQFIEVIRSNYPVLVRDISFGKSRVVLFQRSKQALQMRCPKSNWSNEEFIATKLIPVGQFKIGKSIFFKNRSYVNGFGQVFGVVTIERDNKPLMNGNFPLVYQTFDFNQKFSGNQHIGTLFLGFQLPVNCLPSDSIKFYIWNPNKLGVRSGEWCFGQR